MIALKDGATVPQNGQVSPGIWSILKKDPDKLQNKFDFDLPETESKSPTPDKTAAEREDEREKKGRFIDQILSDKRVCQNQKGEWVRLTDSNLRQEDTAFTGVVYESLKSKYLLTSAEGEWMKVGETQVKNYLETNRGLQMGSGATSKQMRECMDFITRKSNVHISTPLAGYGTGIYSFDGKRVLVTSSPKIIRPKADFWPTIASVLEGMLGEEQIEYFYGWLKIAYTALATGKLVPGQMVVFAGPKDCGKSFAQNYIVTPILGGRHAKPYQYMTGQTAFNSELFQGEHLIIADEVPATEYKERIAFGASIKNLVAEPSQRYHAKGVDAFMLPPFWRVTLSVNDEPEHLMVLPPLDDSIVDKIQLFKVTNPGCLPSDSGEERDQFARKIHDELPAFIYHIVNEHEIRPELRKGRFGIREYVNKDVALSVEELSTEAALMAMIEQEIFNSASLAAESGEWEGTAGELASRLMSSSSSVKLQAERQFKSPIVMGKLLTKLEKSTGAHQGLVKSRLSGGNRKFKVFHRYKQKEE
jgi:Family of unknown function (DUF5906)